MKLIRLLVSLGIALQLISGLSQAATTNEIQQYGITWTFSTQIEFGQFVNGDYWIVDAGSGVNIISITPGYDFNAETGRIKNGSMTNPPANTQGYDNAPFVLTYTSSSNVGIGISESTPLVLHSGDSLVSAISNDTPLDPNEYVSYLKTAAVLTCLNSAPPAGSFRPGYSDPEKTLYNSSNLNYSLLKKLAVPAGSTVTGDGSALPVVASTLTTYAGFLQRPWLMHHESWTSRYLLPNDNVKWTNYYFPRTLAEAGLLLHLNFTNSEKEQLLINYTQLGIDLYGIIKAGQKGWKGEGGFGSGRKWPILFAGLVLNDSGMKSIGQKSGDYLYADGHGPGDQPPDYVSFAEDAQTFYVSQFEVDLSNSPAWNPDTRTAPNYPYTSAMIGMPEWGNRHFMNPEESDADWTTNYRTISSGAQAWAGTALVARIMNAKTLWNHNAHFDYVDRFMAITGGKLDPFGYSVPGEEAGSRPGGLIGAMWDTYRHLYDRRLFRNVRVSAEVEP